jgi:hypothetical protein
MHASDPAGQSCRTGSIVHGCGVHAQVTSNSPGGLIPRILIDVCLPTSIRSRSAPGESLAVANDHSQLS